MTNPHRLTRYGDFNKTKMGRDADSCDAAQAYRFDAARDSWMMPPTVTR